MKSLEFAVLLTKKGSTSSHKVLPDVAILVERLLRYCILALRFSFLQSLLTILIFRKFSRYFSPGYFRYLFSSLSLFIIAFLNSLVMKELLWSWLPLTTFCLTDTCFSISDLSRKSCQLLFTLVK